MKTKEERFWEKVDIRNPNDCWNWTASKDKYGYGVIGIAYKMIKAHRFSWNIHFGEIPDGLFVCHHCDNPSCVNPNHLFLGTNSDNMKDMFFKGRDAKIHGEKHGRHKLTLETIIRIREEYTPESRKELARKYNVSPSHISLIARYKTWRKN